MLFELVQPERLNEETPLVGDAIVRSARNKNLQKSAEMTDSSQYIESVTTKLLQRNRNYARSCCESNSNTSWITPTCSGTFHTGTSCLSRLTCKPVRRVRVVRGIYRVPLANKSRTQSISIRIGEQPCRSIHHFKIWCSGGQGQLLRTFFSDERQMMTCRTWDYFIAIWRSEFPLIDLNAEMPTRRKVVYHRERLNEETPLVGDAIVRSYGNSNHKRPTEMIGPYLLSRVTNSISTLCDKLIKAMHFLYNNLIGGYYAQV